MKTKVSIDQVEHTAQSLSIDSSKVNALIEDLRKSLEEEDEIKVPRQKKQLVIVANVENVNERIAELLTEVPMAVVEYPVDDDHNLILDKINKASYEYNVSKKGRKKPVSKHFESLFNVQRRFFKEQGIGVKSKDISIVVTTDNQIPTGTEAERESSEDSEFVAL